MGDWLLPKQTMQFWSAGCARPGWYLGSNEMNHRCVVRDRESRALDADGSGREISGRVLSNSRNLEQLIRGIGSRSRDVDLCDQRANLLSSVRALARPSWTQGAETFECDE
jgi:hypothetical protein